MLYNMLYIFIRFYSVGGIVYYILFYMKTREISCIGTAAIYLVVVLEWSKTKFHFLSMFLNPLVV